MADANLPTPNSILQQDYRVKDNLVPGAKSVSVYQGATRADVPGAPTTNNLTELAGALQHLQPTLQAAAGYYKTEILDPKEVAAGIAKSEEMQKNNVKDINDAVARGMLDPGASPVYMQSLRENQLAYAIDKKRQRLNEAYWSPENADLRASNDPTKFDAFVTKHNAEFDEGTLKDADGNPQYTALDMARSKYADKTREAVNSVYSQHLQYRVGENEKAGEEIAGLRTSKAIADGLEAGQGHAAIAASVGAIFRDPTTGLVTAGMKASKQTELTVDAVVDAAIERRDVKVLDMLDSMKTSGNSTLAGTSYAKKKVEAAKLHITNDMWLEQERSRTMAERRGAGIATDPEVEQRAKETREQIVKETDLKLKQMSQTNKALDKAVSAEPFQAAIMKHLGNGSSAFDPEVVENLKALSKVDPGAAKEMMTFVQGQQHKSKTETDEKTTLQTYTRLRADLSNDPTKFDHNRIVAEANQGHLTAGQVASLFDDADKSQKAAREYPMLHGQLINGLRADLKGAVGKDPMSEFGETRLQMDKAAAELNSLAMSYMQSHPKATEWELHEKLQPHVERLARKFNPELNLSLTQTETKTKNDQLHQEQAAAKVEREKSFQQPTPQEDAAHAAIRKEFAGRYPNKAQLDQVVEQVFQHRKGK